MKHLLIVELPGGNDSDILIEALAGGDRYTFLTADAAHYRPEHDLARLLARACSVIDVAGFDPEEVMSRVEAAHAVDPFDAVLCLQDLRLIESAMIALRLGLRHLSPACAALCRNKAAVRRRLAERGIAQPDFLEAEGPDALIEAVDRLGLPLIVKPADGFGSQHVFGLRTPEDKGILRRLAGLVADGPRDYGLGVVPTGRILVERLLEGPVIGCDTMSIDGRHRLLGINEKLFFPPPSFAIRGGCFSVNNGQFPEIEEQVFAMLDAIGFDTGAAHIEMTLTPDGPQLVEINPRLVGARIARLIGAARGHSAHRDLIALHAEGQLPLAARGPAYAATRWIAAPAAGRLAAIDLPPIDDPAFFGAISLTRPGSRVRPPLDNADRLGCVITRGQDREAIEDLAERIVAQARIVLAEAA